MTAGGDRLGIDFGTSSTVAVLRGPDGRVRPLLFDASPLLSSAVSIVAGTQLLTGADAERAATAFPAGHEANPKRRIDDGTVWLGEREYPVVDLMAAVLARAAAEASRVAGGPTERTVLTHPAAWSRPRLSALVEAAGRAGLGAVDLVAEPVAAAAYFVEVLGGALPAGRALIVYDLGAGTFDVSIVRRAGKDLEVVAAAGLPDVGGLDLDAVVVAHARSLTAGAAEAWGRLSWPQTPIDRQARYTLWRAARAVKEQLSRHSAAQLYVPIVDVELHLTREEFEKAARPHVERTIELTLRTVREAGLAPELVAGLFLVGGASRLPLVATLLHRTLGIAPTVTDQPELVVAEGSLSAGLAVTTAPMVVAPPPPEILEMSPPLREPASLTAPQPAPPATAQPAPPIPVQPFQSAAQPAPEPRTEPVAAGPRTEPVAAGPGTEPVAAGPETAPEPAMRRVSRRGLLLAAAAVPVAGAAAGLAVWRPWQARPVRSASAGGVLTGHIGTVSGVAFHPRDSSTLISVSRDNSARIWNAATGLPLGDPMVGHSASIVGFALSADGKTLITGGVDGAVNAWDTATRKPSSAVPRSSTTISAVALSRDGKTLAVVDSNRLRLWRLTDHTPLGEPLNDADHKVDAVRFHPSDNGVLASDWADGVRLWDRGTRRAIGADLTGAAPDGNVFEFSPDGDTLAVAGPDYSIMLWDTANHRQIGSLEYGHAGGVAGLAFSPDGATLATCATDRAIRLWDVAGRKVIGPALTGHIDSVTSVAFSPDGKTLASGSVDRTIRLWNLQH
ncbi:Hsp70 family protein [Dactylosporangium darangshiense]|uniref:Hsp70 family protein n=1 Tax=Dactylosporangium darangshiense TaxID=579108 RepID=UPI0031EFE70C